MWMIIILQSTGKYRAEFNEILMKFLYALKPTYILIYYIHIFKLSQPLTVLLNFSVCLMSFSIRIFLYNFLYFFLPGGTRPQLGQNC